MPLRSARNAIHVLLAAVMASFGCEGPWDAAPLRVSDEVTTDTIPTIRQGVYGYVKFCEGDFMPLYPPVGNVGTIRPVERSIVVHLATRFDAVNQVGSPEFCSEIPTLRVAQTRSNAQGFFQVELSLGTYSLFVIENLLFYAQATDENGYLSSITVSRDSLSYVELNITYKATF